mmetsp:Transcript_563/g.1327  ORF Transcript_563/g.1327 Transcript_563/m.1327 type:complete len:492 (+) Transcript_563:31-1506(+)
MKSVTMHPRRRGMMRFLGIGGWLVLRSTEAFQAAPLLLSVHNKKWCQPTSSSSCPTGQSRTLRLVQPLWDTSVMVNGDGDKKNDQEVNGKKDATFLSHKPMLRSDSLLKFSQDIRTVLHELRGSEYDPYIPKHLMGARPSTLSYSKTWNLEDWEVHNSRKRYLRYLVHFPSSRLVRRTAPQLLLLLAWNCVALWIQDHFFQKHSLPLSAMGTISTFLAFLLTLRSNQALARLDEARRLWSKVILNTREMAQLIAAFVFPVDPQMALMLGRHVSLFGWLLKSQLRFTQKEEVVDIVRTMLPHGPDADYVLSQRQKTVAVVVRIRQVIAHLGKRHLLTTAEEMALDHTAHALAETITSTGRIRASPIPTLYTSHSSRLLMFYLLCLPPALHRSGLDNVMTTIVSMVVGFAMLGLDEISHLFEQPFRVIPMYQMSKRSMLAVADSFTCRPPALIQDEDEDSDDKEPKDHLQQQKELTTYWSQKDLSTVSDNLME